MRPIYEESTSETLSMHLTSNFWFLFVDERYCETTYAAIFGKDRCNIPWVASQFIVHWNVLYVIHPFGSHILYESNTCAKLRNWKFIKYLYIWRSMKLAKSSSCWQYDVRNQTIYICPYHGRLWRVLNKPCMQYLVLISSSTHFIQEI
jgi:hypothetical protein